MTAEDLSQRLVAAADERDGEVATLLERASERIDTQETQLSKVRTELQETNEGMVALTLELEEAQQRYRSLFEDAVEGVYKTTPDGRRYVLANESMADILGYDSPETLQRTVTDIRTDVFVDPERHDAFERRLREEGTVENFEYRVVRRDGEVRWVSDNARMLYEDGEKAGFRGGLVDITELREYEQRLETVNEELEALNRVVRHDITNDMQIVRGYAEYLRDHVDEAGEDPLEKIITTADHVLGLTNDAREFIETLSGQEDPELEPTSVSDKLTYEIERQRDAYPDAAFTVSTDIPDVDVTANDMLTSVFRNLLGNAVQHNDTDQPEIDVSCAVLDDTLRVAIADNGPGVPPDRRDVIFGKGEQSLDSDGTGIGLYLVNQLTETYGGDVWVENRDGRRGARFVVELPLA